jgi:hypothetical protein
MSRINTALSAKRIRSVARAHRKAAATRRIPFQGVFIDSVKTVLNHRYLRAHRLPHSPSVASILIA